MRSSGPGSFLEAKKIIPLLVASTPEHPSFHVVAPSLPGFGFSEAPKKKGFATAQYAEVRFHATIHITDTDQLSLAWAQVDAGPGI